MKIIKKHVTIHNNIHIYDLAVDLGNGYIVNVTHASNFPAQDNKQRFNKELKQTIREEIDRRNTIRMKDIRY